MGGKYVPSLLAAIGQILEDHMIAIGFMTDEDAIPIDEALRQSEVFKLGVGSNIKGEKGAVPHFRQCPKCGQASLMRQEDCDTCTNCAYSKCG